MKNNQEEFQHFIFKHEVSGELIQFYIGPVPILVIDFEKQIKAKFKSLGKNYKGPWVMEKAWIWPIEA